jgi:ferritin-like metal-binding protein YciE
MLDDLKDKATGNKMTVENPKELFVHNLGATLTMENTVEEMLGKLVEKAKDSELKKQLRHHREETQAQIRNIHQVFESLGMQAQTNPCPAIEGIEKEGEANLKMADESLHDDVILAGCAETEHHEIAVYEGLITTAEAMGEEDVVALLQENLEQEEATLQKAQQMSQQLAQSVSQTA